MKKILLSIAALISLNIFSATEELSVKPNKTAKKQFVIQVNPLVALAGKFEAEATYLVNENLAIGLKGSYSKFPENVSKALQKNLNKQNKTDILLAPIDDGMIEVGIQAQYSLKSNQKDGFYLNLNPSYRTGSQKIITKEGLFSFSKDVQIIKVAGTVGYQSIFKNGIILSSEIGLAYNHYLKQPTVKTNATTLTKQAEPKYEKFPMLLTGKLLSVGLVF